MSGELDTDTTDVKTEKKALRADTRELEELRHHAKFAGKPFCLTCARHDQVDNNLQPWENYTKGMKKKSTKVIIHKKLQVPMGKMVDYACPNNHGTSVEISYPMRDGTYVIPTADESEVKKLSQMRGG